MTARPPGQRRVPGDVLVHLRRTRDHLDGASRPERRVDVGVRRVPGALLRARRDDVAHVHVHGNLQHREQQDDDEHGDQHELDDGTPPLPAVARGVMERPRCRGPQRACELWGAARSFFSRHS